MMHSALVTPFISYDTNRPRPRMIDWSMDWRDWFDIREPDSAAMIDWSQCIDVESVPDRCGGAWVVRGTRIPVQGILDNAEDCTPEQAPRSVPLSLRYGRQSRA